MDETTQTKEESEDAPAIADAATEVSTNDRRDPKAPLEYCCREFTLRLGTHLREYPTYELKLRWNEDGTRRKQRGPTLLFEWVEEKDARVALRVSAGDSLDALFTGISHCGARRTRFSR